jgi:GT2 family glycosyltransferase
MSDRLLESTRSRDPLLERRQPAPAVTACIPTVGQADDVVRTARSLLEGRAYPGTILVSDGSPVGEGEAWQRVERAVRSLRLPAGSECRLLSPPPRGSATGNRNWLARHVDTPLLLFLDDDIDVHPDFLRDALSSIEDLRADVVVAASTTMGGSGWLTARGHFRPIRTGDPIAVGLACSLWRTNLFRSLWLDERIEYGYEDADLSVRLHRVSSSTVQQSRHDFVHRADCQAFDEAKDRNAERARVYVAAKRYARSRASLVSFLILEIACNAVRRRRLLPGAQVAGQWSDITKFLLGASSPSWAREPDPHISGTDSPGGRK